MRPLIFFFISLFVLSGCIGKKRTTYGKRDRTNTTVERSSEANDKEVPNDDFVTIEINSIEEYITVFAPLAQEEMRRYRIPASITLAQGILESGFGRGALTLKTNNHFGIKCHTGWDGEFERYDDDAKDECFRKYNHPRQSYRDHSIFLSSRKRYASLFELDPLDYKGWARGLKAAGYATDRKYPQKLIGFIERYRLDRFDRPNATASAKPKRKAKRATRFYTVREGDTLYSISRKYCISVSELMALNNLSDSLLSIGQRLKVRTVN